MADDAENHAVNASLTSVEAHGLLNSLSIVRATVSTLRLHWSKLDDEQCLDLLTRAEEQMVFLSESLGDLVRGIPSDTRAFLDGLRQAP